jgi:hypothetical protein
MKKEDAIKKTKSEIMKKIRDLLLIRPMSNYELAKEIGSNWDTIKGNVGLLEELGIVIQENQRVSINVKNKIAIHDDAISGIPLGKDVREKVYCAAKMVYDKWREINKKEPNKTQLQKAIVEVAEKFTALNLPRGWYFYGKVVLVKLDIDALKRGNYKCGKLPVDAIELEEEMAKIVRELGKYSHFELLEFQYKKYGKKDYIIKQEIEKIFFMKNFDKQGFYKNMYELIFNFPAKKNDNLNHKVISLLKDAVSHIISQTNLQNLNEDIAFKAQLYEAFTTLWRLYASYMLLISIEGDLGYDQKIINKIFEDKIDFYINDLTDTFCNYFGTLE